MAQQKREDWMQTMWRPAMGWLYMLVCFTDMIVFPVLWALWQGVNHVPITQWNPLSLQGAGLFHIAMGAVLGIAAFGRTQEKLAGTAANPLATSQTVTNNQNMSGNVAGGFGSNQGGMNSGMGGGFGGQQSGFGGQQGGFGGNTSGGFNNGSSMGGAPAFGAPAAGGFGGSTPAFGSAPTPAFGSTPAPAFGSPTATPTVNAKGQKVIPQDPDPVL
jgi:hypothetical protein